MKPCTGPALRLPMAGICILTCIWACACTDFQAGSYVVGPDAGKPAADAFGQTAQPYIAVRCASLDCHGDKGRPLRLFAEDGLRLRSELRGEPISVVELELNMAAIYGVDPDAEVDQGAALLKPLATGAGGMHHGGADIWEDRNDPGYRCLHGVLSGKLQGGAAAAGETAPCEQALEPWLR